MRCEMFYKTIQLKDDRFMDYYARAILPSTLDQVTDQLIRFGCVIFMNQGKQICVFTHQIYGLAEHE